MVVAFEWLSLLLVVVVVVEVIVRDVVKCVAQQVY